MNQQDFIKKYKSDKPMLKAWACFVLNEIKEKIKSSVSNEKAYSDFIKIPPSYRIKSTDSLVSKAFVRNRDYYKNPYEEITDKAAVRFVVLLTSQLKKASEYVENSDHWSYVKSREFDDWKKNDPRMFDYQSAHYIVNCKEAFKVGNQVIEKGTPCEIQLRTLMQHAYAELAHDTVYKTHVKTEAEVIRSFAKSMALMETTDELLCNAKSALDKASSNINKWKAVIRVESEKRLSNVNLVSDENNFDFLLDAFLPLLKKPKVSIDGFQNFLSDEQYSYIAEKIKRRESSFIEFRQEIILLVYYLANKFRRNFYTKWPLDLKPLELVYTDLGISPPWQTT